MMRSLMGSQRFMNGSWQKYSLISVASIPKLGNPNKLLQPHLSFGSDQRFCRRNPAEILKSCNARVSDQKGQFYGLFGSLDPPLNCLLTSVSVRQELAVPAVAAFASHPQRKVLNRHPDLSSQIPCSILQNNCLFSACWWRSSRTGADVNAFSLLHGCCLSATVRTWGMRRQPLPDSWPLHFQGGDTVRIKRDWCTCTCEITVLGHRNLQLIQPAGLWTFFRK